MVDPLKLEVPQALIGLHRTDSQYAALASDHALNLDVMGSEYHEAALGWAEAALRVANPPLNPEISLNQVGRNTPDVAFKIAAVLMNEIPRLDALGLAENSRLTHETINGLLGGAWKTLSLQSYENTARLLRLLVQSDTVDNGSA